MHFYSLEGSVLEIKSFLDKKELGQANPCPYLSHHALWGEMVIPLQENLMQECNYLRKSGALDPILKKLSIYGELFCLSILEQYGGEWGNSLRVEN